MRRPAGHRNPTHTLPTKGRSVPRNVVYLLLCAVLVATGALMVGQYFAQSPPPPAPPQALGTIPAAMTGPGNGALNPALPAGAHDSQTGTGSATPPSATPPPSPPFSLAPSPPVSVRASVVGINSAVSQVGLTKDGTIEVPTSYDKAAWYRLVPPRTHPR